MRMSANPHANGGLLRRQLRMPDFRDYALEVAKPAQISADEHASRWALCCATSWRKNMNNFRVFGPDENSSNKLDAIYEVSKKLWLADYKPEDADGGELSPDGRVLEMLSEHTLEGWYEGYVLTGPPRLLRHLRGLRPRHRLHVQPARQVARHLRRDPLARADLVHQPADHLDRLASGPQRIHPPGSRLPRRRGQQEPAGDPHLPAARRELPALRRRSLPAQPRRHQRHRLRQAEPPPVPRHGRGRQALHQGTRHLGVGEQRRGLGTGRGDGRLRRHPDQGGARGDGAAARALPGPQDPLHQRGRSVPHDAGERAPARALRPRLRQPVHQGQADHLQLPRLSRG